MKTIEKMILCCIWICIAIVAVLIKDQADLRQKAVIGSIEKREPVIQEESETVVLDESEVMELVASRLPVMREASVAFSDDGQIQMNVIISDSMIEEAEKIINHEAVSVFLPLLKGMEVSCQATISAYEIGLIGCKAGFVSVPEELIELVEQEVNKTWLDLVEKKGIESAEVNSEGLKLALEQE